MPNARAAGGLCLPQAPQEANAVRSSAAAKGPVIGVAWRLRHRRWLNPQGKSTVPGACAGQDHWTGCSSCKCPHPVSHAKLKTVAEAAQPPRRNGGMPERRAQPKSEPTRTAQALWPSLTTGMPCGGGPRPTKSTSPHLFRRGRCFNHQALSLRISSARIHKARLIFTF